MRFLIPMTYNQWLDLYTEWMRIRKKSKNELFRQHLITSLLNRYVHPDHQEVREQFHIDVLSSGINPWPIAPHGDVSQHLFHVFKSVRVVNGYAPDDYALITYNLVSKQSDIISDLVHAHDEVVPKREVGLRMLDHFFDDPLVEQIPADYPGLFHGQHAEHVLRSIKHHERFRELFVHELDDDESSPIKDLGPTTAKDTQTAFGLYDFVDGKVSRGAHLRDVTLMINPHQNLLVSLGAPSEYRTAHNRSFVLHGMHLANLHLEAYVLMGLMNVRGSLRMATQSQQIFESHPDLVTQNFTNVFEDTLSAVHKIIDRVKTLRDRDLPAFSHKAWSLSTYEGSTAYHYEGSFDHEFLRELSRVLERLREHVADTFFEKKCRQLGSHQNNTTRNLEFAPSSSDLVVVSVTRALIRIYDGLATLIKRLKLLSDLNTEVNLYTSHVVSVMSDFACAVRHLWACENLLHMDPWVKEALFECSEEYNADAVTNGPKPPVGMECQLSMILFISMIQSTTDGNQRQHLLPGCVSRMMTGWHLYRLGWINTDQLRGGIAAYDGDFEIICEMTKLVEDANKEVPT